MTSALFLLDRLPTGERFALTGDEGRHAARVRRLSTGESLLVGDGRGGLLDCVVAAVRSDGLDLEVRSRRVVPLPDPRVMIVQALPKGERAELAVETMTELGVDEIVPWSAARSVARWEGARGVKALERWRRTAREAAKQSRRAWVPSVSELARTADVCRLIEGVPALVLHESARDALATTDLPSAGVLVIVVGPEGGISADELAELTAAGARVVRMGEPVLRTSTAGAAALAALSLRLGRWT